MKYKRLTLTAYNESVREENSFHVDVLIDVDHTFDQLMEYVIKPMTACVFSRMIPEMPRPPNGRSTEKFIDDLAAWSEKYYGVMPPFGPPDGAPH